MRVQTCTIQQADLDRPRSHGSRITSGWNNIDVNPLHANLTCVFEHDVDHKYNDIRQVTVHAANNTESCCALCKAEPLCGMWVLVPATKCWLKKNYGKPGTQWVRAPGAISMCTNPTGDGKCPPSHIPTPPPPPPVQHYVCEAKQCVLGSGHISYTDPKCFGQCGNPPANVTIPAIASAS